MGYNDQRTEYANWELLRLAVMQHGKSRTPIKVKDRTRYKARAFDDPTADIAIARADKALARRRAA